MDAMSAGDLSASRGERLWKTLRTGRPLRYVAIGLVLLVVAIFLALLYGDLPEWLRIGGLRRFFRGYTFLPGFALLYIEESGIPLPAPGDVFVLYVGAHIPRNVFAFLVAWMGLIAAVTAGATNLFFISRRWGRQLVESRFAEYVHLSPDRLARAEKWFQRYGVLAIIFGRHIPGFRVPITVAAGIFRVRYPTFAASVAVSSAIWAGIVLLIGISYGPRLEAFLRLHSYMYFIWAALVVGLIAWQFVMSRRDRARALEVERATGR
jgi:membrane protein DedA with SNARE-associated domain